MKKRLLSLLLACLMVVSLVPTAAFAAVGGGEALPAEPPASEPAQELPTQPAESEGAAALADADPVDWCRPNDGTTVTASAVQVLNDATTENDHQGSYTPNCVLGANYGWDFAGGSKNGNPVGTGRWLSKDSRGATHILTVDLGAQRRISAIHLYWFNNNFTGLDVDVSPTADGDDWVNVRTQNSRVLSLIQRLSFAEQEVRRIRITAKNADDQGFSTDADGYYDVSLYRVEAYTTAPTVDDTVTATPPANDVNMAEIQQFGHLAQPNDTFNCSSGKAKVDNNIYIRASASSWAPTTSTNQHPESTTRAGLAFDGDPATAWTSRTDDAQPWIIVNLGTNRNVKGIKLNFGGSNVTNFKIDGTTNPQGESWQTLYEKTDDEAVTAPIATNLNSQTPVTFVRLTVTGHTADTSVVLKEMGIYANDQTPDSADPFEPTTELIAATPVGNLCRPTYCEPADTTATVTATASSVESGTSFTADKAIDGNTNTKANRWSSANNTEAQWLKLDLGKTRAIGMVKLYWERTNVTAYELQASQDGEDWSRVIHSCTSRIAQATESIVLNSPIAARYLRVHVTGHDDQGAAGYKNVALYEVEVYKSKSSVVPTPSEIAETVTFKVEGGKLVPDVIPAGYEVTAYSANLKQVVGGEDDHTVFTPLVDTVVDVDVTVRRTVTDTIGSSRADHPVRVTIPGEHTASEGTNPKPAVIPEIMEWYSSTADSGKKFTLQTTGRIVHRYGAQGIVNAVADELEADLADLFGEEYALEHVHSTGNYNDIIAAANQPGDIVIYNVLPGGLQANLDKTKGFDDETYRIEITENRIIIYATDPTGAYWATRTILQALKLSKEANNTLTIDCGVIRDYPEFPVRGFVLDVGRKPVSMAMLQNIVKNMAWYKLNDFHVHLNDNLIQIEEYGYTSAVHSSNKTQAEKDRIYAEGNRAYAGFRLQSSLQEEEGATPLASRDYHYSKKEFSDFITESAALGVKIVPEIDVPAHAKAITDAWPSLREPTNFNTHALNDHFNLSGKFNESLAKTKEIFNDYIDDGTFHSGVVHFGADEYYPNSTLYRKFHKAMIQYLKSKNVTVRTWGSLSRMASSDAEAQYSQEETAGVQMDLWNTGWANPQAMYDLGFDLINVTDGPFYMVPNGGGGRGGYGDYLDLTAIYDKAPNQIGGTWLPASSSQILGSAYAIWGDSMLGSHSTGMNEVDVFDRFFDALPIMAVRQWGVGSNADGSDARDRTLAEVQADAAILGTAPSSNPYYEADETDHFSYDFTDATDKSGNGHDLELTNAAVDSVRHLLTLNGGTSYAEIGLDRLGWGSQLTFKVFKLAGGGEEQIIFEGNHLAENSAFPYNEFAIKALPVEGKDNVWKLGFSRELHDYEFDVELPVGEWVRLTLTNAKQSTKLSVNGGAPVSAVGKMVAKPNSNTQFKDKTGITYSSFDFPVARIGSKTNALVGYVASVSTSTPIEVPDSFLTATAPSFNSDGLPSYALDGDPSTIYHSKHTDDLTNSPDIRYIQLDLASPATVTGLKYLARANRGNGTITQYEVKVSTDGTNYTSVSSGTWTHPNPVTFQDAANFTPTANVTSVRLYNTASAKFISAAEIELVYSEGSVTLSNATAQLTLGEVTWGETAATVELSVALKPSGFVLTEGTDYDVAYANNTAAGTATVTVTGKGTYTGSLSDTFTVPAKPAVYDLTAATVTLGAASYPLVNGKAEPKPVVKLGEVTLLEGIDYTLSYSGNTNVGTGTVTVTGIAPNTGSKSATFTVTASQQPKNLSNATLTLHKTIFPYQGAAIEPEVVVTYNGETLTKGVDYNVSYKNNDRVGTGTVTITAIAPNTGSKSVTFAIVEPSSLKDLSNVEKTRVVFGAKEYPYTGQAIIPTYKVYYGTTLLTKDTHYTAALSNNIKGGTGILVITGIEAEGYTGNFVATFAITGGGSSGGNTGGSSSGGSGVVSGGSFTTSSDKRPDGSSITTKTYADGAMASTATYPDGSKVVADIPVSGPITAVVTVPSKADQVTVTIPTRGAATAGQVAVILHPDGSQEIVKNSMPTESGVTLTLDASATVQVVDNAKTFVDVPADSWAKDAIAFVTSREIFNGTGNATFSPNGEMSRAMVCTVLANLAGEDTKAGATWYEKGLAWAKEKGVSDTTAPHAIITREQLAVMLYRNAGSPIITDEVPRRFRDRETVSDWAELAVTWAVQNDLLRGRSDPSGLDLAPQATASRAEVASVLQRYVSLLK